MKSVSGTKERRTHSAWLICEGDHDLPFPTSARQLVPLLFWSTHIIKIGSESDSTHVGIVAHVVCDTVAAPFGFISTKVALKRDFGIARDIARISHMRQR